MHSSDEVSRNITPSEADLYIFGSSLLLDASESVVDKSEERVTNFDHYSNIT